MGTMKKRNINLLYLHQALFTVADSLFILVMPVFLYRVFGTVSAVFFTALAWNVMYLVLVLPLFNAGMKWGRPKYMMVIGVLFYAATMLSYANMTAEKTYWVIPGVIFTGLYVSFYWMTRHWFFSVNADHGVIGKQVSFMEITKTLAGFIGPLLGGFLSFTVSFNAAYWMGGLFAFFSLLPILFFHAPPHPEKYTIKKVREVLNKSEMKAMRPAYVWEGFSQYLINTCWVLAFTIFVGNIKSLGILVAFATLIAVLLSRITGHLFDKQKREELLIRTTLMRVLGTLAYASIFFIRGPVYVWITDIFNRFAGSMHQTTVDSYLFGYSAKKHPIEFHLNREINLTTARIVASLSLGLFFLWAPPEWLWAAITIGAFTLVGWMSLKKSDYLLR